MNVEEAKDYIKGKHGNQKRRQGTPYYLHPVMVSNILKEKGFSDDYQLVGLFHDLLEDTSATYSELLKLSNKEIADAVKLLTKEDGYDIDEYISRIKNNDIAKMVKLADRLHNLSEVHLTDKDFQNKYIDETEKWYIPLAKGTIFENDIKNVLVKLKK